MPYKLSATLKAHSQDVRGLASPTNDLVLSGSRDATAIAWSRDQATNSFSPTTVLRAGSGFVNAVAYIPPTNDAPKGYIVAGGQDALVNIWSLENPKDDPDLALVGHQQNVCAIHVGTDRTIISGSWDNTARVWKNFQLAYELKGHTQSVWGVLALPGDRYLTGSADKTIKFWHQDECIRTYQGSEDVVRGLAILTDIGFASCSNSGNISLWTTEGDLVDTLSGHTSFVYAIAVLPSGDLVSAGEDRTVRVWHDFENTQTILHPAISVWAVSTMPNGDIVTGCSDGVVRVFSEAEERWVSADELKAYDELIANQERPQHEVANVKTSDPSVLTRPGTKHGQIVIVKNSAGALEAHEWHSGEHIWKKSGEVVGAPGPARQLYEGREYDYVFSIDVQEGAPALKLPYNVTENPYSAAQRFLENHNLPMAYLDQVVEFINKNTEGQSLGTSGGGSQYVDPYTGASRYQANENSVPTGPRSTYVDPYTGASRYAPVGGASTSAGSGYQDPYTGSGRYVPASQQTLPPLSAPARAPVTQEPKILPVRKQLTFKQATVSRIRDKVIEFSDAFKSEISMAHIAIYPNNARRFDQIFAYLTVATDPASISAEDVLTQEHLDVLAEVLDSWPLESRWPVLDVARLVCVFSSNAFSKAGSKPQFFEALLKACDWNGSWEPNTISKNRATNVTLALRAIANALQLGTSLADVRGVLEALESIPYGVLEKQQRYALATLLYNVSCLAIDSTVDRSLRTRHLKLVFQILSPESTNTPDPETLFRALVSLGNITYAARNQKSPLQSGEVDQARVALAVASSVSEARIDAMVQDVKLLL